MRKALSGIIGGALLATALVAGAAPASAVIVPNYIECSTVTGKCVQQNGPYNRYVPTACHWVFRTIWTGNRSKALCDYWV